MTNGAIVYGLSILGCLLSTCSVSAQSSEVSLLQTALGKNCVVHSLNPDSTITVQITRDSEKAVTRLQSLPRQLRSEVHSVFLKSPFVEPRVAWGLESLEGLRFLHVSEGAWNSYISEVVSKSDTIDSVFAEAAGLTADDLSAICKAKSLKVLMIGDNPHVTPELGKISSLKNLRQLSLSNLRITTTDVAFLSELRELRWLMLDGTDVEDGLVSVLVKCPQLKTVALTRTKFSRNGADELARGLPGANISVEGSALK